MEQVYLGIDPGLFGGIACIDENNKILYKAITPLNAAKNDYEIYNMLLLIQKRTTLNNVFCVIEKPIAMPFQGSKVVSKIFLGYGIWTALLSISLLQWKPIEPKIWSIAIIGKEECKKKTTAEQRKIRNAHLAQKLFSESWKPARTKEGLQEVKGVSDALLLALYAKQLVLGKEFTFVPVTEKSNKVREYNFFTDD